MSPKLSPTLLAYLVRLFEKLDESNIAWLLPRQRDLQELGGFDLDLLVGVSELHAVREVAQNIAQGLIICHHSKQNGLKLLIIDTCATPQGRRWLLLDIQSRLRFSPELEFSIGDIAIHPLELTECVIKVPTMAWQSLLDLLHALRKGRWSAQTSQSLRSTLEFHRQAFTGLANATLPHSDTVRLCEQLLTDGPLQITDRLDELASELGIARYDEHGSSPLRWRTRLARFAFEYLLFRPRHTPCWFTILGPDGVGKSTTVAALTELMKELPIEFKQFHHMQETKGVALRKAREKAALDEATKVGWLNRWCRTVLRFGWRQLLPASARVTIVALQGEVLYAWRVNKLLSAGHFQGQLVVMDRYCYDRYVKALIIPLVGIQRHLLRISTRMMRRPRLAFLLTDDPAAVHARKQELDPAEIAAYFDRMRGECTRLGVNLREVPIMRRQTPEVAREILSTILKSAGEDLFRCVGIWEQHHKDKV